ncbi:MAG TPA: methyltransferase domain-containing protein, partial [Candidatus Bilamarchaeaceae archaeon]|nr:methyltransferase domain-containing protein [Candidatus Bilamarchaeaceae archaeon]
MEAASSSACPACDSSGARKTGAYGEYSLLRCGACGLVFSDPLAHPSAEFYEKSETYEKRGEMIGMPYLSEGLPEGDIDYKFWNFSKFFRDGIKPGGSLLDVGCAEGVFLGEAAKRGYCAVGIDINRRAIERIRAARPGLDVHACTLGEFLKGDGRTFDVITSFEVLEHLE